MFRLSAVILLIFVSGSLLYSQDLTKYYIHRVQEPNDLYFIFPFKEYQAVDDKSPFYFDITYLQGMDSVVLNYTYYSEEPMPSDSLIFILGDRVLSLPSLRIYEDYLKKEWESRFQVKIPFNELTGIMKSPAVPGIRVISAGKEKTYFLKEKKWEPYSDAVDKILYIIQSDSP